MKLKVFRPNYLPQSTFRERPRLLPFPDRGSCDRPAVSQSTHEAHDAELSQIRDRLFRMIVANQWDRSNGNRAS